MLSETLQALEQVLSLPEEDRKFVVEQTWQSFSALEPMPVPPPCLEEIEARIQAVREGTAILFTGEEAKERRAKILADHLQRHSHSVL